MRHQTKFSPTRAVLEMNRPAANRAERRAIEQNQLRRERRARRALQHLTRASS